MFAAGNVTYDQLKSTISEAPQAILAHVGHTRGEQEPAPTESERQNEIFMWDGALHRLPKDNVLTARGTDTSSSTFHTAAQALALALSCNRHGFACTEKKFPAGFSMKNSRKRFSDWRMLCK